MPTPLYTSFIESNKGLQMQKKSHKRKFQVGQMVKVLGSVSVTQNNWITLINLFGKEFSIKEYKFQTALQMAREQGV